MMKLDVQDLQVSITNWIILSDYLKESPEMKIFIKVVRDYALILPLYKLYQIFTLAERNLSEIDFEVLIEELWENIHEQQEAEQCLNEWNIHTKVI